MHLSCKHSHIPFRTPTFFIVPWHREAAQNSSAISSHQVSSGPKSDVFPPLPLLSSIVKTVCPGSTCVSLKDKTNDQILVCVLWGTQHLWCHSCLFYPSRFNHDIPPSCHCTLKTPGELHHARKGHLQALGDRNSRKRQQQTGTELSGVGWTIEQLNSWMEDKHDFIFPSSSFLSDLCQFLWWFAWFPDTKEQLGSNAFYRMNSRYDHL